MINEDEKLSVKIGFKISPKERRELEEYLIKNKTSITAVLRKLLFKEIRREENV